MRRSLNLILLAIFYTSCYSPRYVYSPATQNIPLLTKKDDIAVGGYISTTTASNAPRGDNSANVGLDLHGAFALTNHFSVMLNYYRRWESNGANNNVVAGDSISIKYHRQLTELGVGYSSPEKDNSIFQFFAGIAFGKFMIAENNLQRGNMTSRFHNSDIQKIFIQPAIISGIRKNFTPEFSSRFSMVYYNNIQTDYTDTELSNYFLSDLSHSPVFFWEPAMNYIIGFKKVPGIKLALQMGLSILLNHKFVDYRTMNLAAGLTSDLKFKNVIPKIHKEPAP